MLYDLVNNDDSILSKQSTRVVFGNDSDLIAALLKHIKDADLSDQTSYSIRDYVLLCLQRIYRKSPQLTSVVQPALTAHLEALKAFDNADRKSQVDKEIETVTNVLKVEEERAQNVEDPVNFPDEKPAHIQTWEDGTRFVGVTADGNKRNGPGIFIMSNGDRYEGNYVNNKREGEGTYYYVDGSKYVGSFKNGRREG